MPQNLIRGRRLMIMPVQARTRQSFPVFGTPIIMGRVFAPPARSPSMSSASFKSSRESIAKNVIAAMTVFCMSPSMPAKAPPKRKMLAAR